MIVGRLRTAIERFLQERRDSKLEKAQTRRSKARGTLKPVSCGTDLNVVQEGVPDAIPPEMCYLGWQESLEQLARLVEPEIKEPGDA